MLRLALAGCLGANLVQEQERLMASPRFLAAWAVLVALFAVSSAQQVRDTPKRSE